LLKEGSDYIKMEWLRFLGGLLVCYVGYFFLFGTKDEAMRFV